MTERINHLAHSIFPGHVWKVTNIVKRLKAPLSLSGDNYQGFGGMDDRGGGTNFGNQSGGQDGSANGASASQGGISVPDFLPPAQRVLFMRIQQKQQEEEERARRIAEGGAEKSRDTEGRGKNMCILSSKYKTSL